MVTKKSLGDWQGESSGSGSRRPSHLPPCPSGPRGDADPAGGARGRGPSRGGAGARARAVRPAPPPRPAPPAPPPLSWCRAGGRCGGRGCCFLGPFCCGAAGRRSRRGDPGRGAASRRRPRGLRAFRGRGDLGGQRDRRGGGPESRARRAERPFAPPAP